jgi:squalene synthase HpnC
MAIRTPAQNPRGLASKIFIACSHPHLYPSSQSYAVVDSPSSISPAALAHTHYENFSVLSFLVPRHLRPHFANIYWFCRTADDLADEHDGSPAARQQALTSLRHFRERFNDALSEPAHKDSHLTSLASTIHAHRLNPALFHSLLDAFEQDQTVTRYHTLDQLLDYCTRSANPVGRIVLQLSGLDLAAPSSAPLLTQSDAICTALQLVNHCQDLRRDLLERDRVYLPSIDPESTAARLRLIATAPSSPALGDETLTHLTPVIAAARALFEQGRDLPLALRRHSSADLRAIAPTIHLFLQGGLAIQSLVERDAASLIWQRPRISKPARLLLVLGSAFWKLRH